jgi:hypothetical protein
MLTTHLRLALTQHITHTIFAPLQTLAAQQAEDRAGNEAAFAQARQELALKWQERMSHMQEQLMVNQQQMLERHEEETASLLVSVAVDSMLAQLESAQPSFGSCRTEGVVLLRCCAAVVCSTDIVHFERLSWTELSKLTRRPRIALTPLTLFITCCVVMCGAAGCPDEHSSTAPLHPSASQHAPRGAQPGRAKQLFKSQQGTISVFNGPSTAYLILCWTQMCCRGRC